MHENDWEDLNNSTLAFLQEIILEILNEVYIVPDERNKKQAKIKDLQSKANPKPGKKDE